MANEFGLCNPVVSMSIRVNPVRREILSRRDGKEAKGYTNHLEDRGTSHIRMRTEARAARGGSQEDEV